MTLIVTLTLPLTLTITHILNLIQTTILNYNPYNELQCCSSRDPLYCRHDLKSSVFFVPICSFNSLSYQWISLHSTFPSYLMALCHLQLLCFLLRHLAHDTMIQVSTTTFPFSYLSISISHMINSFFLRASTPAHTFSFVFPFLPPSLHTVPSKCMKLSICMTFFPSISVSEFRSSYYQPLQQQVQTRSCASNRLFST